MTEIRTLSDRERLDWLRLIRTPNIGPIVFFQILERFGGASKAIEGLPEVMSRRGHRGFKLVSKAEATREIEGYTKLGARLIGYCEPDYPHLLRTVRDAPPLLWTLGHPVLLQKRSIAAIVGTRNASLNGQKFAAYLAAELGKLDYTIVSGLALGIDGAAQKAAVPYGTAAILAGGIDSIYPYQHTALYHQIKEAGLLISEGVSPKLRRSNFPIRNRLISGVSLGVVVIESSVRSGSLITARHALDQGREVFAVPGSPFDTRVQGCNLLIKQGAVLVQSAADVDEVLSGLPLSDMTESKPLDWVDDDDALQFDPEQIDQAYQYLEQILNLEPTNIDQVIRGGPFSTSVVLSAIAEMEIVGKLAREGHQIYLLS